MFFSLVHWFIAAPLLLSSCPTPSITSICVHGLPNKARRSHGPVSIRCHIKETLVLNNNGVLYCWFCQRHNTGQFAQHPTKKSFWKMTFRYLCFSSKFHPHGKYWKTTSLPLPLCLSFSLSPFPSPPKLFSSLLLAQSHTTHGPLTSHFQSHYRRSCGKCGWDPCSAFSPLVSRQIFICALSLCLLVSSMRSGLCLNALCVLHHGLHGNSVQ